VELWIDYNGSNLEVRYSDGGPRPALPNLSEALDLASILGAPQAFVGFTSGTGSAFSDHDILQWQFNSEFAPIETTTVEPVPEVQTYASAFGAALIAAQMLRRRLAKKA